MECFKLIEWSFLFYYNFTHYINSFSLKYTKKLKIYDFAKILLNFIS